MNLELERQLIFRSVILTSACADVEDSHAGTDLVEERHDECHGILIFSTDLGCLTDLTSNCGLLSLQTIHKPGSWSSLVVEDEGWIGPSRNCCVYPKPEKKLQHMHGMIPKLLTVGTIQLLISFY